MSDRNDAPTRDRHRIRPLEDRLAAQRFLIELLKTPAGPHRARSPGETAEPDRTHRDDPGHYDPPARAPVMREAGTAESGHESAASLSPEQWDCVVEEASRHRLGALVWRLLADGRVNAPVDTVKRLRLHYVQNAFRNAVLFRETATVADALAAESIPVMLLKGMHLARFVYDEPAIRSMADIDLLVPRSRIHDVERTLVGMGYGPLPRPDVEAHCAWSNHLPSFRKAGAEVLEVHYDIERPTSPFAIDAADLWREARHAELDGAPVALLSTSHLLPHLCLHLAYHHKFERSALKGLVDIATVLRNSRDVDWDRLVATANQWKAGAFTYATLRLVREILGAPVPKQALDALEHDEEDDAVVAVAGRFVLGPTIDLSESLVEIQRTHGWWNRLVKFFRSVFLPPARLRELYGLEADSRRVWLMYPVRVADLLRRQGGLLVHVAMRTPVVSPVFDRERDRLQIERWAGYDDARTLGPAR